MKKQEKWNFKCDLYDSSIRDWKGNRVWEHDVTWWNAEHEKDTKEEVEYYLFENTLDGNLHGTGGKYTCIEWGKGSLSLPKEQQEELDKLDELRWNSPEKDELDNLRKSDKYKDLKYDKWVETQETEEHLKELVAKIRSYEKEYNKKRYNYWYEAWQNYLNDKKKAQKVVLTVYYLGARMYVKSIGTRTIKFCHSKENARVFKEPKEVILNKLDGFSVEEPMFEAV